MKRYLFLLATILPAALIYSCHRDHGPAPEGGGEGYLDLPETTYNYYPNSGQGMDSINSMATLGRVLFYERQLSINNSVSCGTCHKQAFAFADNVAGSAGFENRKTARNTPALQNLGTSGFFLTNGPGGPKFTGGGSLFWDGRENNMEKLITRPISNHVEMGMADLDAMVEKLKSRAYYKELFLRAFGSDDITKERISLSVGLFVNAIRAENTRFDQEQQRHGGVLSALELEGEFLFNQKYDCSNCHNENPGGYFSGVFANIGLDAPYTDKGMGVISGNSADNGRFKVPNLRNVTLTAPYMHDGRFKTLNEVLEHYSHGIKPDANLDEQLKTNGSPMRMNISQHEKDAIIAFLGTLTDADMLTNSNYSDPFKVR
jgi:cytochrome c peroxidase